MTMPALGETVTEGTVTRWLKEVGDEVTADEPLLEVSTDKVDTEIPAPVAGTLLEITVGEDETAEVGAKLAVIGAGRRRLRPPRRSRRPRRRPRSRPRRRPRPRRSRRPPPRPSRARGRDRAARRRLRRQRRAAGRVADVRAGPAGGRRRPRPLGRRPATAAARTSRPLVRKLAAEHGVDLGSVTGTGVGGRIRKQDVLAAAEQAGRRPPPPRPRPRRPRPPRPPSPGRRRPSPLRGRTEKMSRLRAVIARRMVESLQVSAQLTTVVEVDVTRIARLRQQAKADFEAREGVKLSFLPFFAKAAVEALKAHPTVNASIDKDAGTITYHDAEHLGIAVDTERGLLVPVIHDAGDLNLGGIARKIADLAERTRTNKVTPDELGGGTFTLTNTGSRGALFDTPIINQPQVGILGIGAVVKRPVVVEDPELGEVIAVRSMVYLALTYDHRLVDGADAARFLTTVKERLEAGAVRGRARPRLTHRRGPARAGARRGPCIAAAAGVRQGGAP